MFAELYSKTRALAALNERLEERVKARTAELERSEAALRLAAEQKDEFLAILAHELRNPLVPLRTGVDLLIPWRAASLPSPSCRPHAGGDEPPARPHRASHRRSPGRVAHQPRRAGAEEAARRPRDDRAGRRRDVPRRVDRQASDRASWSRRPRRLYAATSTSTRVSQIIGNLLHNASKFTPDHGRVTVELRLRCGPRRWCSVTRRPASVIPREQLGSGSSRCSRDQIARRAGRRLGTGIGLALAQAASPRRTRARSRRDSSRGEGLGTTFDKDVA